MNLPQIIKPKRHADGRGWFSETFRETWLRDIRSGLALRSGKPIVFQTGRNAARNAFSGSAGRAGQADSVLRGRILDVAVDVRRNSPTYGKHVSTELSAESGRQIYIPVGFAHGFLTLEDDVMVMYKVSDYYAPAHDSGIRWNDPDIAMPWPMSEPTSSFGQGPAASAAQGISPVRSL